MWKAQCTAWKERKSLINVFLGLKMTWKMFGGKAKLMGVLGAISMELHFSHGANLNLAIIRAKMVRFWGVVIHNPKTHIRVKLQRKLGLATNCMQWLTRSASIGRLLGYKSIKAVGKFVAFVYVGSLVDKTTHKASAVTSNLHKTYQFWENQR